MIPRILRRLGLPFLALVILPIAALRAQPVVTLLSSAYSVELGQTAVLSGVRVTGQSPFTYQWVKQGPSNTTIVMHDGASGTGSTYVGTANDFCSIEATTAADAGEYAIEVTDANGYTTTSAWIALTVKPPAPPTITNEPANLTVVAGNQASFYITATGSYPRTYQWYKGTPPSGTAAGATSDPFTISSALASDAGSYYAVITNDYGSATGTAVTLTVNPATPITFPSTVSPQTAYVGQSLTLSIFNNNGSTPITYQWQKDGTPIAGATSQFYSISAVAAGDAGTYTLVETNVAGSVTSPGLVLTVDPAVPVSFPSSVNPQTFTVGDVLSLYMSAAGGSSPITYQWQKDGVNIVGATGNNYYKNSATTADSGNYTVIATNPAGSATSPVIKVTVNPPVPPSITVPPANVSVSQGNPAQFGVTALGTYPFTFQWMKNGTPITGATSQTYEVPATQPADAGSYSVTVTNAAGSATSPAATLTVLPPVAPSFSGAWMSQESVTVGENLTLSTPYPDSNGAVGPYTYQWFKDGAAISGATDSYYTISTTQVSDAGTYAVTVTNAGGTVAAPPFEVKVAPAASTATAWTDAAQQGSVVYFLFSQHIERYDLSTGTWLPSTTLSQPATAFCVASDGVYVAFGRAVAKFPLDLSSQTTLANLGGSVASMFSLGSYVYAQVALSSNYGLYPIDRTSGAVGAALSTNIDQPASFVVDATAQRVYTPGGIWGPDFLSPDSNGTLTDRVNTTYYGTFPRGTRGYLLPDQQHFADNGGTIFNVSDGSFAATFGGSFTDMTFLSDGTPVVLRDNVLSTYAVGGTKEIARAVLNVTGSRVFASGSNVDVFYPGTSSGNSYVGMTQVAAAAINSGYVTAPASDPAHLAFAPTAVLQDTAGTVYLYDAAHENIFRWSPSSQAYLASIPLAGAPARILYSDTENALYCVYLSGRITKVDLGASAPAEQPFSAFPLRVDSATGAGNFLFAVLQDAEDSGEEEVLLDARTGALTTLRGWSYYGRDYAWSQANQTLYAREESYTSGSGDVQPVSSTGTLPAGTFDLTGGSGDIYPSADGSRLLATGGQIYDATGLSLGVLGNSGSYAAWLGSTPYTMRENAGGGTEIQGWSPTNFILVDTAELSGTPVNLLSVGGNQLLAITEDDGVPAFTNLSATLQRVSTTAPSGSTSGAPTFVTQPAPSLSVYSGSNITLAVDTDGATPQTYQWYKNDVAISGATGATLSLSSVSSVDAANYHVTVTNSAGSATSPTTTLSIYPALAFTSQPQSQTAAAGSTATFKASVSDATGASYQWYFNGNAISGATSDTLVISPVDWTSNYGTYVLKASNPAGAIYSSAVTLSAPPTSPPTITSQPQSVSVQPGATVTLTVSGANASSYQWFFNGTPISGATSSVYTLSSATTANTGSYTVALTGPGGTTTSAVATVTVRYLPPNITAQPSAAVVVAGNSASFSVSGQNVTSYQWYFQGSAIAGATSGIYAIPVVSAANVGNYDVVLTGPGGTATSNTVSLTLQSTTGAPVVTTQPASVSAAAGGTITLSVAANNATSYQWYHNGVAVSGATSATLVLSNLSATAAGSYTVTITGAGGSVTSNAATVSVLASSFAGTYFGTITGGGEWALWVPASGEARFIGYTPQHSIAVVADLTVEPSGAFYASTFSNYDAPGSQVMLPNAVTGQISNGGVTGSLNNSGGLLDGALDTGTAYPALAGYYPSFALNGVDGESYAVVGASGKTFVVWVDFQTLGAQPDSASGMLTGDPQFSATSALGRAVTVSLDSNSGLLSETLAGTNNSVVSFTALSSSAPNTARLLNLSARADVGVGGNVLIAGFSIAGTGSKGILVRGVGPTLKTYGVSNPLASPQLVVKDSADTQLWAGTAWGGSAALVSAFNAVGAFPLDPTSADAAHSFVANQGGYTATVSGADGGTGVALAEVYDTDRNPNSARLINLSARASVGGGDGVLIAGLVIGGNGPETVLLRGIGPALKNYGVTNYLAKPQLTLFDNAGNAIAANTGWTDAGLTTNTLMSQLGAFQLTPGSADCVLRATLMPGNYTVQVASADQSSGVALVEVYEVK